MHFWPSIQVSRWTKTSAARRDTIRKTRGLIGYPWLAIRVQLAGALAQSTEPFDIHKYQHLLEASSTETIAPGTVIDVHNWLQYKRFMSISHQTLFSGKYVWKVADSPDAAITVAPTRHIPLPANYRADTEKYHNQVRLVPVSTGEYVIEGYVAGLPFPDPSGPQAGVELLYDNFYEYQSHILYNTYDGMSVARYSNRSSLGSIEVFHERTHRSDPGVPRNDPQGAGYYLALFMRLRIPNSQSTQRSYS